MQSPSESICKIIQKSLKTVELSISKYWIVKINFPFQINIVLRKIYLGTLMF